MFQVSDAWKATFPDAHAGVLVMRDVENPPHHAALEAQKALLEKRLRERFAGQDRTEIGKLPILQAYETYYRRFKKTYHVQLQLESIVLKGKHFPEVSPAVDANFMAELETSILTAGHDCRKLLGPIVMDVSREGEQMTQMNGMSKAIRSGDMIMRDAEGICCSIIYGQDARSPISPETSHVLYVAYAPAGVPAEIVESQLRGIEENIRLFSVDTTVEQRRLLTT